MDTGDPVRLSLACPGHQLQHGLHKTGNPSGVAPAGGGTRPELTGSRDDVWEEPARVSRHDICSQTRALPRTCWKSKSGCPAGRGPTAGTSTQEVFKGNLHPQSGYRAVQGQTSQLLISCFKYLIRQRRGKAASAGSSNGEYTLMS